MRIKLSFLMVALILTLWGQIKGQELHIINHYNIENYSYEYDVEIGIKNFGYFEKYNLFIYSDYYTNLNIRSTESNKTIYKIKDIEDFRVNKNNYITFYKNKISIYDPANNTLIDTCEVPTDLTVDDWNMSNNGDFIVGLALKSGTERWNWYKSCEILIWNAENGLLLKRTPYHSNLAQELTSDQLCVPARIEISGNLKYFIIEWTKIDNWGKPFQSDQAGLDLIDMQSETLINRINNVYNSQFFPTIDSAVAMSNNNGAGDKNLKLNLISCKDGKISYQYDMNIITNSANPYMNFVLLNNLILCSKLTDDCKNLFVTNIKTNTTQIFTSIFYIHHLRLYEHTLVAQGLNDLTFYDISPMADVKENNSKTIIYPNPTKDKLNLVMKYDLNGFAKIIDEMGNVVDSFDIYNTNSFNYDTGKLQKGIYILQINSKTDSKSYKFIKE